MWNVLLNHVPALDSVPGILARTLTCSILTTQRRGKLCLFAVSVSPRDDQVSPLARFPSPPGMYQGQL